MHTSMAHRLLTTMPIQWGKNSLFNKSFWDSWRATSERMKVEPHTLHHMLKMDQHLNVRTKPTKRLEENPGINLHDNEVSSGFLTPKAQEKKNRQTGLPFYNSVFQKTLSRE